MNKYLIKIAGVLDAKLGMGEGQKVPNQTLQVMSQVGDPKTKKQARGTLNLKARGAPRPGPGTMLSQKLPKIKI